MVKLDEELAHALRFGAEVAVPHNESNTCEWVILPLLWGLGYERFEIASRTHDAVGKVPDYTVLPNTGMTWYLEAKAWQQELSSAHVDQALNYAHSNARRWVVLSNGREWHLYDDSISGFSAQRLVATASLSNRDQIRRFLQALSKESLQAGSIEAFAASQRLHRVLQDQLARPDSEVVKAIVSTLRMKLGMRGVTGADVSSSLALASQPSDTMFSGSRSCSGQTVPSTVRESRPTLKIGAKSQDDATYLISPVKSEDGKTAEAIIRSLLDRGWYVFADATKGRKRLKPGDWICFYQGKKGVVAECQVASAPEIGEVPGVKAPHKYRWRFRVQHPRYFFESPIPIDVALRRKLDGFVDKDPESTTWSWFVQGTCIVSAHDFALLTGRNVE
ncbi:MAG: type I restriction enzyme HsdR N-terminal domain-containing protein [Fimbriimonadaceae bacterium]|nr:hypothetical protein [Chthonomonadaceae bacterium]MCO5298051.1 type I restriction enzyme HsdR N-terminal domain-containing protein [Fimbriimonadaceae bacterium]